MKTTCLNDFIIYFLLFVGNVFEPVKGTLPRYSTPPTGDAATICRDAAAL